MRPAIDAVGRQQIDGGFVCCHKIFGRIPANLEAKFTARFFTAFSRGL
jgi:hypothetical protein